MISRMKGTVRLRWPSRRDRRERRGCQAQADGSAGGHDRPGDRPEPDLRVDARASGGAWRSPNPRRPVPRLVGVVALPDDDGTRAAISDAGRELRRVGARTPTSTCTWCATSLARHQGHVEPATTRTSSSAPERAAGAGPRRADAGRRRPFPRGADRRAHAGAGTGPAPAPTFDTAAAPVTTQGEILQETARSRRVIRPFPVVRMRAA